MPDRKLSFREWALEYQKQKLEHPDLRKSTKKLFSSVVRVHLIPAFGDLDIQDVTNQRWLAWIKLTREDPKGVRVFFNQRKYLKEILSQAFEAGHIAKMPKLYNPDTVPDAGRMLTVREILRILRRVYIPDLRFFFYVLWKTGFRPKEVLQWEWSMFVWDEPGKSLIKVPGRIVKTDRSRIVPLNSGVSRRLFSRYARGLGSKFVFPHSKDPECHRDSYKPTWDFACTRARVADATPYDFRRTFISRCAAEGYPMILVAKMLDTSLKEIERVYLKPQHEVGRQFVK